MENSHKISVIVPIYGVERFIERCTVSLMEQTLDDVEYLFVDDASKDKSIEILKSVLKRYPERDNYVKILTHKVNAGLPAARNTGLKEASGEFVFHCDSDDYLESDALEVLYKTAKDNDADIVWSDWYLTFEQNERYMHEPSFDTSSDALKAMLGGGMKYNVWNKLVKRAIYNDHNITFPSGYSMGEDMTIMMLFANADKVCHVSKALYHYVKMNTGAITSSFSQKNADSLKHNVERTTIYLTEQFGNKFEKEISFLKLEAKFPLLIMAPDYSLFRLWNQWYPEANKYIWDNKNVSFRSRFIQSCANYKLYFIVWLHYQIVCRFIYGIIYK